MKKTGWLEKLANGDSSDVRYPSRKRSDSHICAPTTKISSSELVGLIHDAGERVNRTGVSERINGIKLIPNRPKDTSAASWGCLTVIVCIVVAVVRVMMGG